MGPRPIIYPEWPKKAVKTHDMQVLRWNSEQKCQPLTRNCEVIFVRRVQAHIRTRYLLPTIELTCDTN
jgi:hypothetical protein